MEKTPRETILDGVLWDQARLFLEVVAVRVRNWLAWLLLTALLVAGVGLWSLRSVPDVPVYEGETEFQASQAMLYLSELATRFPQRDYASPGRIGAAEWIAAELGQLGLQVYTQEFSEVIAGRQVDGLRNVYAVLPGQIARAILVVAHYNIPPYVREGAADDASGVATMMELARVFAQTDPRWTMIFMASDSEEYGGRGGSYRFLADSGWGDRLAAVVSLDHANMGRMKGIKVRSMGIHQGYAPLWLREMANLAAAREAPAMDVGPVMEWVERAMAVAPTEHGAYLAAGIPAVDLAGVPEDPAFQRWNYHTPGDTAGKVLPETVGKYGRAAERLLWALDGVENWPAGEMRYLKLGARYLPGRAVTLLQLLALLPLAGGVLASWRAVGRTAGNGRQREVRREIGAELRHLAALFLAGGLGYLALWLAPEALGRLYSLPFFLVAPAMVLGYLALRRLLRLEGSVSPAVRRVVALTSLLGIAVAAVAVGGGFAVLAFLAPAIYLWPLVRETGHRAGFLVSAALTASVLVVFTAFLVLFSGLYFSGPAWWHILRCAASGLFRARAVFTFLGAAVLFVRFASALLPAGAARPSVLQVEPAASPAGGNPSA